MATLEELGVRRSSGDSYNKAALLKTATFIFMAAFYGFLLSRDPYRPAFQTLTFNNMLSHMLHGRFDVDQTVVGNEGFLRNGRIYAYWGILCSLFRVPLVLANKGSVDMTVFSCTSAVCLAGFAKIRTLLLIRKRSPLAQETQWPQTLMLLYILMGGSEVAYLRSSLFQETVFWGSALGAVFVYFAMTGLVESGFRDKALVWMAVTAGLATMARVDMGLGLCVAFLLLLIRLTFAEKSQGGVNHTLLSRRLLLPFLVLVALLFVVGLVNYERWGNPWTFADFRLYLMNRQYPDRLVRLQQYSYFNVRRIPFGLMYYFAPIWVLHSSGGPMLLEATRTRLIDVAELPPSSFLLTDAFPLLLVGLLAKTLSIARRTQGILTGFLAPLTVGLAVPCCLLLMASSMTYRYRMDFYPLIDLLAFTGLFLSLKDSEAFARLCRWRRPLTATVVLSIVCSLSAMILYKLSYWGPGEVWLHQGLINFYVRSALP